MLRSEYVYAVSLREINTLSLLSSELATTDSSDEVSCFLQMLLYIPPMIHLFQLPVSFFIARMFLT